jgi:hypothetical protein
VGLVVVIVIELAWPKCEFTQAFTRGLTTMMAGEDGGGGGNGGEKKCGSTFLVT